MVHLLPSRPSSKHVKLKILNIAGATRPTLLVRKLGSSQNALERPWHSLALSLVPLSEQITLTAFGLPISNRNFCSLESLMISLQRGLINILICQNAAH
jgi:hypothetical protein